jgi:hypothetical protein
MSSQFIKVNQQNNGSIIRLPSGMKSMGYDLYEFYWFCDCFNDTKMRLMTNHLWDFPVESIMQDYCPCNKCKVSYCISKK